jgi:hypothetical protein
MCFADKSGKAWKKGVKTMPLMDKDLVLTTKDAPRRGNSFLL